MEVGIYDVFFDHDDPEPDLQRSGAKRKEPHFPSVRTSVPGQMVRAQDKLSLDSNFNPRNTAIS